MKFNYKSIFIFLLLEVIFVVLFAKAVIINTTFINFESSSIYRIFQTISHDSLIYFLMILTAYLSYQPFTKYIFAVILRLFSLSIFLIYIIDIYVLFYFSNHLVLNDIVKYFDYSLKFINQVYVLKTSHLIILLISISFCFLFILIDYKIKKKSIHILLSSIIISFLLLYIFSEKGRYIHSWIFKNFIEYNYEVLTQSKQYSENFKNNLKEPISKNCIEDKSIHKNIIVLMVESLASYQSNFFSGIKNLTPNLDKLAKENLSFTNFYANGFVTEDAEIAILTGEFPIYGPYSYSNAGGAAFNGFYNIKSSLPFLLKSKGYNSEFITSSDLEFSNTGEWAKSLGFDYIEGSEHKYYIDKKRYHFNAAEDKYLYDRIIKRIEKQNSKYFFFIKTVSSHAPYITPNSKINSEKGTINYIDSQIGNFYKKLLKQNFFKNGILFIVGDHHPVVPVKSEAIKKFGEIKAPALVPMIIVSDKTKKQVNKQFQQTDIYNTIKNIVSNKKCTSNWYGDMLKTETANPKYILHRRGDQRGIISVFIKQNAYNILLNGDDTSFLENIKYDEVLNKINYSRVQREKIEFQKN